MKQMCAVLLCGSLSLGSAFAPAAQSRCESADVGARSGAECAGPVEVQVNGSPVGSSKHRAATNDTPIDLMALATNNEPLKGVARESILTAIQQVDPAPTSQPATPALILAGLIAVLYISRRRRPEF